MYSEAFIEEFARRFEKSDGCWEWTRGKDGSGYGKMPYQGKSLKAHRVAYELHNGRIPEGKHILHACDNPACVRPEHLSAGTHQDNMADKTAKRRAVGAAPGARHGAKLASNEVLDIFTDPRPHRDLARRYEVSTTAIGDIKSGRTWSAVTNCVYGAKKAEEQERKRYIQKIEALERKVKELELLVHQ